MSIKITKDDLKHIDNIMMFLQEGKAEMNLKDAGETFNSWIWLSNKREQLLKPDEEVGYQKPPVRPTVKKKTVKKKGK